MLCRKFELISTLNICVIIFIFILLFRDALITRLERQLQEKENEIKILK